MKGANGVKKTTEIAVVGAGPAGLTAAIALAAAGASVSLIGRPSGDARTTALLASSVTALETLNIWPRCRDLAAPLKIMRIVDDTQRLWRAPETEFVSEEIGLEAFGWNIQNRDFVTALTGQVQATKTIASYAEDASAIVPREDDVEIELSGGEKITAQLVIGADGRRSLCRAAAGIDTEGHEYPQTALTFNLVHTRPHHDVSTEFHTPSGPFTLVPLMGQRSSLVWAVKLHEAERIATLDDPALALEIERQSHSILGKITLEEGRGRFPLSVQTARRFASGQIVLVGEAAHTIPPIGAQGFNLGLRDIATIAELVAEAKRDGGDIASNHVIQTYDERRRGDASARKMAIDLLNRSLLTDFLPVQGARGLGLYMLDRIGPLRRAVMREGVAPTKSSPRLMRGEAL
jgi:2-octaprenyl-6-methoxyphenol hydroxylase